MRDWSPDDLPVDEMSAYGYLLIPATVTITEAFMGVEAQLPYYLDTGDLLIGEKQLRDIPSEAMFGDRWGFEEGRHRPTFGRILVASGVRTESQVAKYNAQVLQQGWSPKDHPGLDSLMGIRIYRMFQERATYVNDRGLLHLIRQDYGLPQSLTDEEREKGHLIGAAEGVDKVSKDEPAGKFLEPDWIKFRRNILELGRMLRKNGLLGKMKKNNEESDII